MLHLGVFLVFLRFPFGLLWGFLRFVFEFVSCFLAVGPTLGFVLWSRSGRFLGLSRLHVFILAFRSGQTLGASRLLTQLFILSRVFMHDNSDLATLFLS